MWCPLSTDQPDWLRMSCPSITRHFRKNKECWKAIQFWQLPWRRHAIFKKRRLYFKVTHTSTMSFIGLASFVHHHLDKLFDSIGVGLDAGASHAYLDVSSVADGVAQQRPCWVSIGYIHVGSELLTLKHVSRLGQRKEFLRHAPRGLTLYKGLGPQPTCWVVQRTSVIDWGIRSGRLVTTTSHRHGPRRAIPEMGSNAGISCSLLSAAMSKIWNIKTGCFQFDISQMSAFWSCFFNH